MKIVNIWGGPCSGKSTTAAGLFFEMKKLGLNVEIVTEYAKDMVYEHRQNVLGDQIYVFAKQQRRISRLQNHGIDWVITDSPIPLGLVYLQPGVLSEHFYHLVWEVFNKYDNHNFVLSRNVKYNPVGRNQKQEAEAVLFDQAVHQLLAQWKVPFTSVVGGEPAVPTILDAIKISKSENA